MVKDVLQGLNSPQRRAVETIEGPVLIVAGPGSGKTRVITHRIAYLIRVCGISPYRIMAVTFTNKAAREMKERIQRLLGQDSENLSLGTFHAVCARILRQEGREIGIPPDFVIYDQEDQIGLVKRAIQEAKLDSKRYVPRAFQSAISAAKSGLLTPGDYARQVSSYFEEVVQRIYERYQALLSQSKALDFDDLLMRTVQLFADCPAVLSRYQSRYQHVLVDEFQDTNKAQYLLTKQIAGKHHNLCVVGDPDQSIYSWRFADLRNILSFEKDYSDATVITLEQNYRSTKTILSLASQVIAANRERKEKALWTENEEGDLVNLIETFSEEEEAQFIAREMERLSAESIASPSGCAIMYRTNAQSRPLEECFVRYGIPYRLVGGPRFYERREVKDVLAYLRLVQNPYDAISLSRVINVPGRGIGQRTFDELLLWSQRLEIPAYDALCLLEKQDAQEEGEVKPPFQQRSRIALLGFLQLLKELVAGSQDLSPPQLLDFLLDRIGYREYILAGEEGEERWENVQELRTVAQRYAGLPPREGLASFLEEVSLASSGDELPENPDRVTLTTLHQAKGLEFDVVFIVGVENGILPHVKSFDDPAQMEEERRLFFVGITRARKRLYLLRAYRRSLMGRSSGNPPSPFLDDIPPSLLKTVSLQMETEEFARPLVHVPASPSSSWVPQAGERVRHSKFGDGIVLSSIAVRNDREVEVAFQGGVGVKKLLLSLAPLVKQGESG